MPEQARVLSLQQVLALAQEHAPMLVAARARLGLGDAALAAARPALRENPELELGVGPRTTVGREPSVDLKLKLQQRIELGGQRGARVDAARSLRALEGERLQAVRFAVGARVGAAFHQLLLAQERARSAAQIEVVQARVVEIASGRLKAGDIGPLGVRLAEADLALTTQARIEAEADVEVARLQLCGLAGVPTDALASVAGTLPVPVTSFDADALLQQARTVQPARRVALAELAEREQRARVASRERWSGLAIGVELSHEDRNQNVALATISAPLPLFATNQGPRAQARAELDLGRAELEALDQALPLRIRTWTVAAEAAARRITVFDRDVLPRFAETLALIGRAFELGELDALEVSAARARLAEARATALDSYADYLDAIANLQLETGVEAPAGRTP